jgi:hypothetical protein
MNLNKICLFLCLLAALPMAAQPALKVSAGKDAKTTDWWPALWKTSESGSIRVAGNPQILDSKYGKALLFDGIRDGIFLDQMPLKGLDQFTVEMIICPSTGGNFEQRYFHCGEVKGSRIMLELRSTASDWYLDAFVQSGDQHKTLVDSTKLHPLGQWAHVAFVVENGRQTTFVNGKKELESQLIIQPLQEGKTSVGVRQNEVSWFKGAIYQIRFSDKALNPVQFLKF